MPLEDSSGGMFYMLMALSRCVVLTYGKQLTSMMATEMEN